MLIMQMVPPKLPEDNFLSLQRMAARQVHFQAEVQGRGAGRPKSWPKLSSEQYCWLPLIGWDVKPFLSISLVEDLQILGKQVA